MKKLSILLSSIVLVAFAVQFIGCNPEDTTKPVITLIGDQTMVHTLNATFTDPGATAVDDEDGDLTASITTTGTVNKDLAGTYVITYTVSDAAGNTATATRNVLVKNQAEILNGAYSVIDDVGGSISNYNDNITASGTQNLRVWVTKFAFYTNGAVYFDVNLTNNTIVLPQQTVTCGNPAAARTFVGTGTINGTTLVINYTETTGGTAVTGIETYTKQ